MSDDKVRTHLDFSKIVCPSGCDYLKEGVIYIDMNGLYCRDCGAQLIYKKEIEQ